MRDNKNFNLSDLLEYLKTGFKAYSLSLFYASMLLFYAYQNDNTPSWAKRIILGAIAYVLTPLDAVPDLTPFLGMTDDLGVVSFALVSIACYIDDSVREKAQKQVFGTKKEDVQSQKLIAEVEKWL